MPRPVSYRRTAADRRRLAEAGRCIDCGVAARPLRVTGPSAVRDRTHHRCNGCYKLWQRRRALWDRLHHAIGHARVVVTQPVLCSVCRFVHQPGAAGYWVTAARSVEAPASPFVCRDCHDDAHDHFGTLPAHLACVFVGDHALFCPPVAAHGCALLVGHPAGFAQLAVSARRLAYEFQSDFPFALPLNVYSGVRRPGLIEAYLHVRPERFQAPVLFAVVETALLVLGAARVELAFSNVVRRQVAAAVYDTYGAAARRRLAAGAGPGRR